MNVIKNSLKKRLSSLEKDPVNKKVIKNNALDSLRCKTQLGFSSSLQGGPTFELRQHIQERLSIGRSRERQSIDIRDDQSVEVFNAQKNLNSRTGSFLSEKGQRESFNSKNEGHRSKLIEQTSTFRHKDSSTSSKRGRQSNQRN